jgi:hypothetical protein
MRCLGEERGRRERGGCRGGDGSEEAEEEGSKSNKKISEKATKSSVKPKKEISKTISSTAKKKIPTTAKEIVLREPLVKTQARGNGSNIIYSM